uniref:Uncharacterized protein n=1 Tax=Arundo donax TaxID=35708 RepID=A0A0A9GNS1_ARUDO
MVGKRKALPTGREFDSPFSQKKVPHWLFSVLYV